MMTGSHFKKQREALGLSVYQVSRLAEVGYQTLYDFEAGKRQPQKRTMERLMAWLGSADPTGTRTKPAAQHAGDDGQEEAGDPPAEQDDGEQPDAELRDAQATGEAVLAHIDSALAELRKARTCLTDDAEEEGAGGTLAERLDAIEALLRKKGWM